MITGERLRDAAARLHHLVRGRQPMRAVDLVPGALGALVGVTATGLLARAAMSGGWNAPLLIPSIGASAVLVFGVPASPLAQPRAVIGGNLVSALVGVSCALIAPTPWLAAGLAVGLSIIAMAVAGCLHPPGGAVALGAALTGGAAGVQTYPTVLTPVALCSVLMVLSGVLIVRLTGRTYPHRVVAAASPHATRDPPPAQRAGFTPADLDTALSRYGELLDVAPEDLDALFREVELQAHQRIHSRIPCGQIMSRDVISVDLGQSAESALVHLQRHDLRTAPVIDGHGRVAGMVRRAELVAGVGRPLSALLDPKVHRVRPDTPVESLLPILSSGETHEAMVVDEDGVLRGVITQTDLLAVLYRAHIVEAIAPRPQNEAVRATEP